MSSFSSQPPNKPPHIKNPNRTYRLNIEQLCYINPKFKHSFFLMQKNIYHFKCEQWQSETDKKKKTRRKARDD